MAADTKHSKTNKTNSFSRMVWYIWLKFFMEHKWDLDLFTIDIDPSIDVHSNHLFFETTVAMIFKFHMLHDQTAGLQNDEIQLSQELKMVTLTKQQNQ